MLHIYFEQEGRFEANNLSLYPSDSQGLNYKERRQTKSIHQRNL